MLFTKDNSLVVYCRDAHYVRKRPWLVAKYANSHFAFCEGDIPLEYSARIHEKDTQPTSMMRAAGRTRSGSAASSCPSFHTIKTMTKKADSEGSLRTRASVREKLRDGGRAARGGAHTAISTATPTLPWCQSVAAASGQQLEDRRREQRAQKDPQALAWRGCLTVLAEKTVVASPQHYGKDVHYGQILDQSKKLTSNGQEVRM